MSKLNKSDCIYLHKKLLESQDRIFRFIAGGCKESGFGDDLMTCVSLIELSNVIETKLGLNRNQIMKMKQTLMNCRAYVEMDARNKKTPLSIELLSEIDGVLENDH